MSMLRAPLRHTLRLNAPRRCFSLTASRQRSTEPTPSLIDKLEEQLHPRELVERKRREMEAKYGDKLAARARACVYTFISSLLSDMMV
jgi:hypothetical protein